MDIENISKKFIGDDEERAVSPVIGVILMVAITVILAAVIAAFVLDLGQSTGAEAQAGITFNEDSDGVDITVTSIERAEEFIINVDHDGSAGACELDGTGGSSNDFDATHTAEIGTIDSLDCSGLGDSEYADITITGTYDGSESVLSQYEFEGSS